MGKTLTWSGAFTPRTLLAAVEVCRGNRDELPQARGCCHWRSRPREPDDHNKFRVSTGRPVQVLRVVGSRRRSRLWDFSEAAGFRAATVALFQSLERRRYTRG